MARLTTAERTGSSRFPSGLVIFLISINLILGTCLSVEIASTRDYNGALEFTGALALIVYASASLFAFRIASRKSSRIGGRLHEWAPVLLSLLVAAFLAVNLPLFPNMIGADISVQQWWGVEALTHSLSYLYLSNTLKVDYPPLYMYCLYFNAWLTNGNLFGKYAICLHPDRFSFTVLPC